jgi:glutamate synthase (NADPH/NADH) small chain
MASTCPKCHQVIPDDGVCCSDVEYTWKCQKCGKLSTGFVVPYGKCFLCGGELKVIKSYNIEDPQALAVVEEALQLEMNSYIFYKLAEEKTANLARREIFEELKLKELDHIQTINEKYHIHLDEKELEVPKDVGEIIALDIFKGISFDENESCLKGVYEKAIEIEKRTHDFFKSKADSLPDGPDKEICRELAAEEEEHIAMLETEMAQFES